MFKREAGTQNYNQYVTHIEIEICTKERGNIGEGKLKSAWGLGECFAEDVQAVSWEVRGSWPGDQERNGVLGLSTSMIRGRQGCREGERGSREMTIICCS